MQIHRNQATEPLGWRRRFLVALFVGAGLSVCAVVSTHVETGALSDVAEGGKLFRSDCAVCHGRDATGARGPDLTRGTFRHAADDAALFRVIGMGIPGSPMPGALSSRPEPAVWQLVAYVRSLNRGSELPDDGAAIDGKRIFEERGRCLTCHLINGRGAPRAGFERDWSTPNAGFAAALIVQPNAEVDAAWWSVRVVDAGGKVHFARRMDDDTYPSGCSTTAGSCRSIAREAVRSIEVLRSSTMPAYASQLTAAEIDDLVAYLSTLGRR